MKTAGQKLKFTLLLAIFLQCTAAFSQKENYDIVDYILPEGWTKQEMEGVRIFTKENQKSGSYYLISLFKSKPSNGIDADFDNAWHNIPVSVYKGPEKPLSKERSDAVDGWKVISSSAQLKIENKDAICLLTVLSNDTRTLCVFALLNDETYFAGIEKFLEGLEINQTTLANISDIQDTAITSASTSQQFIHHSGSFDNFVYRLPENWITKQEATYLELNLPVVAQIPAMTQEQILT